MRAAAAALAIGATVLTAPLGILALGAAAANVQPTGPGSFPSSGVFSATAAPYLGGPTGCVVPDPTGTGGCVTGSVAWALAQTWSSWGDWPVSCWDRHAWNPRSDHPRGLGCDWTVGRLGRFPTAQERARGWELARWLLDNAGPLSVTYVIWDGQYCRPGAACRPYSGGGVYSPTDVTGGHFDHVHVSHADRSGTPR